LLSSRGVNQRFEVAYLTQGLDWHADYVLSVDADDKVADLNGWVTVKNDTGTSYDRAQLKLVAGDVRRTAPPEPPSEQSAAPLPPLPPAAPKFEEQSFFEYHLYALDRPTSLLDKEQKQVSLLSASNVAVLKKLIFSASPRYFRSDFRRVVTNEKVQVYLDLENKQQHGLGMALPKGTVRVYKSDKAGQAQFIAEDAIDHTARDEHLRIKLGATVDVVGQRSQTSFQALGPCLTESEWKIVLRNHKDGAENVLVSEPVGGDWQILASSLPATSSDASSFTFDVPLAPRSETQLTYRVRVRWC
jgi:hypothetical protein